MSNIGNEITICLGTDVDCTNVHIDWLSTKGLIVPCKDAGCITVALDPYSSSAEKCLEGFIICLDTHGHPSCKNCEPVYFKKCFCSTDSDCGDCGTCGSDGLCTDTCTAEETLQGKTCYASGCACPPDKPVVDPKTGVCSQCVSGSVNPDNPCRVCIDGTWITKDCGTDAICDQTSSNGSCIPDCSLNVNGRTRYNSTTLECDCEIGMRWSTVKEICVVDEDCSPGFERNVITDECEPINCPPNHHYDATVEDCVSDGCLNAACEDGTNCGEGCGCSQTVTNSDGSAVCISCDEDPTALGCGDTCQPVYCDEKNPCLSVGCTCIDNACTGCNNFPCNTCGEHKGCDCLDGVTCKGDGDNGCKDDARIKAEDCILESTLELENPCLCSSIGASAKVLSLIKSGNTGLETYTINLEADLRKSFANSSSEYESNLRFDNSSINNELPLPGSNVTFTITPWYKDLTTTVSAAHVSLAVIVTKDISSSAVASTVVETGNLLIGTNTANLEFIGYTVKVSYNDIDFENNCSYGSGELYNSSSRQSPNETVIPFYLTIGKLTSSFKENPTLTWERSGSAFAKVNGVFRKLFKEAVASRSYKDILYSPEKFTTDAERGAQDLKISNFGGLLPTLTYKAEWSCTCEPPKVIENLTMCDVDFVLGTHFSMQNNPSNTAICNDAFKITNDFELCDLNKDLKAFGWSSDIAAAYQTKYILEVNGASTGVSFQYKNGSLKLSSDLSKPFVGYVFNHTEQITSVALVQNHDSSCRADNTIPLLINDAIVNIDCDNGEVMVTVISNGTNVIGTSLNNAAIGTGVVTHSGLQNNTLYTLNIEYDGGCIKSQPITGDCCSDDSLVFDINDALGRGINVKKVLLQTAAGQTMTSIVIGGNEKLDPDETTDVFEDEIILTENTTPVVVTTEDGCEYSIIADTPDNTLTSVEIVPSIVCNGGSAEFQLSGLIDGASITMISPSNVSTTQVVATDGTAVFTGLTEGGAYQISSYNGSDPGVIKELTVEENPSLTSFTIINPQANYCVGSDITVEVIGTANSTVALNDGAGNNYSIPLGVDGVGTQVLSYSSINTFTITLNSITSGTCPVTLTNTLSVITVATPSMTITDSCVDLSAGSLSDIDLVVNTTNVVQVTYTHNGNLPQLLSNQGGGLFTATVTGGAADSVVIIATSSNGCETEETVILSQCNCGTIVTPPEVAIEKVCGGVDVPVTFTNPLNGLKLQWFNTDTNTELTPIEYSKNLGVGNYKVQYLDESTGCVSNMPRMFSVEDGSLLTINLAVSDTAPVVNQTVTFVAAVTGINGVSLADVVYEWYVDNNLQTTTSDIFVYQFLDSTLHNIEVIARRGTTLCTISDNVDITATTTCVPRVFNITQANSCSDAVVSITNSNPADTIEWYISGTSTVIATGDTLDRALLPEGNTSVSVKVYSEGIVACSSQENFTMSNCGCICNEVGVCSTTIASYTNVSGSGLILDDVVLKGGKTYVFSLGDNGRADRFRISFDNVVTVDTGYFKVRYNNDLGDCPAMSGLPYVSTAGIADGADVTANIIAQDANGPGIVNGGIQVFKGNGTYNVQPLVDVWEFAYTPVADEVLTVEHNDAACNSQGSYNFKIFCI